jgi:hypothetical protein
MFDTVLKKRYEPENWSIFRLIALFKHRVEGSSRGVREEQDKITIFEMGEEKNFQFFSSPISKIV